MKVGAIILAGGSGKRMNSRIKKQYMKIENKPIFIISLKKIIEIKEIEEIILVIPKEDKNYINNVLSKNQIKKIKIAYSGERRQDSVVNGLKKIENSNKVLIHDSVRPFFTEKLVMNGIKKLRSYDAVIPGIPVKDTIKKKANGIVKRTLERSKLVAVQTPQFFDYNKLKKLHKKFNQKNFTDDSYLFELKDKEVSIIIGLEENIKITTPFDFEIAKLLVKKGRVDV